MFLPVDRQGIPLGERLLVNRSGSCYLGMAYFLIVSLKRGAVDAENGGRLCDIATRAAQCRVD
jgi:hypothetical protein